MAGNKKTKYMAGGGKSTKYKAAGVKKMFGGGLTNGKGTKGSAMGGPAMKKNK